MKKLGKISLLSVVSILSVVVMIHASATSTPVTPIQHIVFIVQENHSFDNYFGTYPHLISHFALNKSACEPINHTSNQGCISPWNADTMSQIVENVNLGHQTSLAVAAYDGGKMDGFVWSQILGSFVNSTTMSYPMAYYTNYTIPNYWNYAAKYTLDANFYSSERGPSYPNHLYLIAGQDGGIINNTPEFNLTFNNIANVMSHYNIGWKYYSGGWNDSIDCHSPITSSYLQTKGILVAMQYWNVLVDFPAFQKNTTTCHNLLTTQEFFNNVTNGYLPAVSWVIPGGPYASEHPCTGQGCGLGIIQGQEYVSSVVNAIMANPQLWSTTAIFITWDDYGGYYDHMNPKSVDTQGYGFREPLLVISPYVKHGGIAYGINGTQQDFTALLKTIEYNWNLPSLTHRDSSTYPLFYMFNFNQTANSPLFMPTGKLSVFPPSKCIQLGLCSTTKPATASYTRSLLSTIPNSTASNSED